MFTFICCSTFLVILFIIRIFISSLAARLLTCKELCVLIISYIIFICEERTLICYLAETYTLCKCITTYLYILLFSNICAVTLCYTFIAIIFLFNYIFLALLAYFLIIIIRLIHIVNAFCHAELARNVLFTRINALNRFSIIITIAFWSAYIIKHFAGTSISMTYF